MREIRNELAYHVAGNPGMASKLGEMLFSALEEFEMMTQGRGALPPPLLP